MTALELLPKLQERGIKFRVEGDKLKFVAPEGAITPELRAQLKLHKAELIELFGTVHQPEQDKLTITPVPRAASGPTVKPASYPQQRLWFLEQLDSGKSTFNIKLALRLNGRLNTQALQQSLNQQVARHESLRTTFREEDGIPMQVIHPEGNLPLELIDVQHLPPDQREAEAMRLLIDAAHEPFDLVEGPLSRARLFRLSETEHFFIHVVHHIVSDGWSEGVKQRELTELYAAAVENRPADLKDLRVQYADFSEWQHNWLDSPEAAKQLNYWETQLEDAPSALELPTDFPRPVETSGHGAELIKRMPPELLAGIKQLSQDQGVTPFMTMLAAFKTVLYRQTGQEDMVVGTSIANRTLREIEPLIGFFLNTLVLRTDMSDNPTFSDLLNRMRTTTLDAFANQQIPVEKLIERLNQTRKSSNSSLFQVLFIYQNMPYKILEWPEVTVKRIPLTSKSAKFDITLSVMEEKGDLVCDIEYSTDLFEEATIERLFEQMQALLCQAVKTPNKPINELPLLSPSAEANLMALADGPKLEAPPFTAVPQWFEAQVEKSPAHTAVVHYNQSISYAQLNQRANQLARHLQKQGVSANSIVGLCFNRSIDMLVGLMGILKAGGAYLPLDPAYPAERLALMLEDAQVQTVVTEATLVEMLPQTDATFVLLDQDWPQIATEEASNLHVEPAPQDLAYVIYTSGSTGKPKGVMIPHNALTHFTQAAIHLYDITETDRMLQFATINFDAAVEEIFPTLVQGATLCLRTEEMMDSMTEFLEQTAVYNITMLDLPTAFWHQLVSSLVDDGLSLPDSLRLLIIGGEKASGQKVADWHRAVDGKVRLFNTYGPTETTVVATAYELPATGAPQLVTQGMSIGRALAHGQAFVLDAQQQLVPVGVPGELVLGGPQVALGYLHRPELTATAFIPHPFRTGETVYRTGDQVRLLPDGNLEFWGRVDDQVKIRGFRVEPGEIEAFLVRETAVREAVVLPREDANGEMQLVAYVVSDDATIESADLRDALQQELPPYMIPAAFVTLDEIPLTPNGKVDKRALPTDFEIGSDREIVAPRTEVEIALANIWQELLGVSQISIHDNFFGLGGHSLKAMQLVSRILKHFEVKFPLRLLFEASSMAEMATIIETLQQVTKKPQLATLPDGDDDFEEGEI